MKRFSIPIKYGVATAAGLIAYFFILSLFGLHKYPLFSIFNVVIMAGGMLLALKNYRDRKGKKFKYQKGFGTGILTGFNATIIFTIFFGIYVSELRPNFQEELVTMWVDDWFINIGMLLFTVALMGFATTVVLTLAFMQYFKDSWNTKEGQKHTL